MEDKRLYLYYKENGNKVPLGDFTTFNEISEWCEKNCTTIKDSHYYNGNRVLCGYHLSETERKQKLC